MRLLKKVGLKFIMFRGTSQKIVFAGSTDQPEKYYGTADLLIHPTFYDACSLTVLEALASGLPVITTSSNGASGILRQGEDGWVIQKPTDVNQLSMAIKHYFDYSLRQEGDRAKVYSEKINFEKVTAIFKDLLKYRYE